MYAWRGYAGTHMLTDDPNRITLTSTDQGEVVGTITIGLDSESGILADELFKPEIDAYRARGARVCEFTKLAFDANGGSRQSMAALWHLAFLHAHDLHHCTHLFIEVNPRHHRFYQKMMGFQLLSEPRMNPRVNAPAYLLCLDLDYMKSEVERVGGGRAAPGDRSFYTHFYSPREQAGIIGRLKGMS
ncbi:N-acetyltransferase [Pseudoduganella albidiflava]|nr:N-acetyltransferase [Pseudoduganella albidiflava]